MDKYEYRVKTEQMLAYAEKKAYKKAMEIADTIDWRRVRNASMLCTVSEIYENAGEYQKSRDVLFVAYDRSPGSRKIVYRLGILALRLNDVKEATDCYEEFVQLAPKDPNQFILRYKILRAQRAPIHQQIEALSNFKKAEYVEKWAFELAKLYHEAGMAEECLEECDDLILWFSEGKYVYQAMELKMRYKPLTPAQQEKYRQHNAQEDKSNKIINIRPELKKEVQPEIKPEVEELIPEEAAGDVEEVIEEAPEVVVEEAPEEKKQENVRAKHVDTVSQKTGTMKIEEILQNWEAQQKEVAKVIEKENEKRQQEKSERKAKLDTVQILSADIQRLLDELEGKEPEEFEFDEAVPAEAFDDVVENIDELFEEPEEEPEIENKGDLIESLLVFDEDNEDEELTEDEELDEEYEVAEDFEEDFLEEDDFIENPTPMAEEDLEDEEEEDYEDFEEEDDYEVDEDFLEEDDYEVDEDFLEEDDYEEAEDFLEEEDYEEAEDFLEEDDYEEAEDFLEEDDYEEAEDFLEEDDYEEAEDFLEEDDYEEAEDFLEEDDYEEAEDFLEEDDYEEAEDFLEEDDYEEAEDFLEEDDYEEAEDFLEEDDYEEDLEEEEPIEEIEEFEDTQSMIKRSPGGVVLDTGFVVQGRYDLEAQSEIGLKAGLTEEQKKLFSYFVPVRGMSEQIVDVLEADKRCKKRFGTSRTGNIVITGRKGSGKTVLAVDLVKAIQKARKIKQGKVAIVTGEALNKKEISNIIDKLHGGALIIERAGKMNARTVRELNELMEEQTGELLIVLEEETKPLEKMMSTNPGFKKKFTSKIELPVFINDELVTFGQTYAKENGYSIDEMGILALYSKIDMMQKEDHAVTVAEVKDVMDAAIAHSQKANVKHLVKRVFGKSTDSSDRIILKEDDFK